MDRYQLYAFLVLIEAGSFSEAARRLGTTDCCLRMLITALETKLNAHLYDVTGPYVLLTDAGRHLLLNWSLFLGQIDSLVETMWKSS